MAQSRCFKTISTMKWIRTSRMSMKSSLSLRGPWLGVQGSARPSAHPSGRASCGAGASSSAVQYKPLGMARSLSYRGTSLITPPPSPEDPANTIPTSLQGLGRHPRAAALREVGENPAILLEYVALPNDELPGGVSAACSSTRLSLPNDEFPPNDEFVPRKRGVFSCREPRPPA